MTLDPSDYLIQKDLYPLLFPVAPGILCTPASTAPVESVFSASGEVTRGKRNLLPNDNLARKTLVPKNYLFYGSKYSNYQRCFISPCQT